MRLISGWAGANSGVTTQSFAWPEGLGRCCGVVACLEIRITVLILCRESLMLLDFSALLRRYRLSGIAVKHQFLYLFRSCRQVLHS